MTVGDEASVAGPLPGDKDQGAVKATLMPRYPEYGPAHEAKGLGQELTPLLEADLSL